MTSHPIQAFRSERNKFIETIAESIHTLKYVYSGENNDFHIDVIMYQYERD